MRSANVDAAPRSQTADNGHECIDGGNPAHAGPVPTATDSFSDNLERIARELGSDPLPMPIGTFILFHHLVVRPAHGHYPTRLTEGQCEYCGKEQEHESALMIFDERSARIEVQCQFCGGNHVIWSVTDSTIPSNTDSIPAS